MIVRRSLSIIRRVLIANPTIFKHLSTLPLTSSSTPSTPMKLNLKMKELIGSRRYKDALDLFERQSKISTDITLNLALKACSKLRDRERGVRIHQQLSAQSLANSFIQVSLIHFYMQCGDTDRARRLFSAIEKKNIAMYGAIFKGYITNGMPDQVPALFNDMAAKPDEIVLTLLFNACAKLTDANAIKTGREVLKRISSSVLDHDHLVNSAIDMLMTFGDVAQAESLFTRSEKKTVVSYGAMLKGYVKNGMPEKALDLYESMSIPSNEVIDLILFNACATMSNERARALGQRVLKQMPSAFLEHQNLVNSAIDMLMKFGDVAQAEHLFKHLKKKTVVSYGALMQGYVKNDLPERALDLLEKVPFSSDEVLYAIGFSACAALLNPKAKTIGKKYLQQMPQSFLPNEIVTSSALHMLMKFGDVEEAERLFSRMKSPDMSITGVMMNGYNLNDQPHKCLQLFHRIKDQNITLNEVIPLSAVCACSHIGLLSVSRTVTNHLPTQSLKRRYLQNALIDMWGKVSAIDEARGLYRSISQPDVITHNSMINAYARNGMGSNAIDVYREMPQHIRDQVSHICVLNGCSHAGLIDQARSIFSAINKKTEKIVGTMVDCLSRMAMFDEARQLVDDYEKSQPPSPMMYTAMLSGARTQRQSDLSQQLYDRMKSLFPDQKPDLIAASVLLSNTYSSVGDEKKSQEVRIDRLKQFGNEMKLGLSWTEVHGELVQLRAHDSFHLRSPKMIAGIERLSRDLKEHGHEFDGSWVTRPLHDGETIDSVLCGHSEKLAIVLNLIQEPRPSTIQITKNLRVCGDCHRATKLIAWMYQIEIIIRDANRIHHFYKNGQCSCQDHF